MERMTDEELEKIWNRIGDILQEDRAIINRKEGEYRGSWRKRGGIGAFFNLERKWDRIVEACSRTGWDLFEAFQADRRPEGLLDDIQDLRRYLALVEEYLTREMNGVAADTDTTPSR